MPLSAPTPYRKQTHAKRPTSKFYSKKPMSYKYKTLEISQLGIIGAGHIGPDIALHFARTLAPAGAQVILVDIAQEALTQAQEKLERKTDRMASKGQI
ncbi:MAG: hypothetical protein LBE78_09545, partial [Burkholderiaceae bacterium]|nr:hypothetical protein [Burkholderiaceae bacterium]